MKQLSSRKWFPSCHRWAIIAAILAAAFLISCTAKPPAAVSVPTSGPQFALALVPGPEYKTTTRWFIFTVPITPQIACWLETPDGKYIATIFVTAKGAKKAWMSAPAGGRPEALPVWFHIQSHETPSVDAVSGASPGGEFHKTFSLPEGLKPGRYIARLEINRSYDYNETYTKANAGVTGQPSLIYSCEITVGSGASLGVFAPIGTGSLDGSDGNIRPGLKGITTALNLLQSAEIRYLED